MADDKKSGPSLWDQLPARERSRIQRELAEKNKQEPGQKPRSANGKFQLKGYIRCELSVADKDAFREWESAHSATECCERLVKAADSGYLLKIGESGQGFQASLCAASTGQDWDGYVLTAHAAHAFRAIQLLTYKHEVLMGSTWSEWLTEDGEDFFR